MLMGLLPDGPVGWVLALMLVVFGILAARFLVAYLEERQRRSGRASDDVVDAADRTARWGAVVVMGILGALATGIVQFADVIDMATQFIASHPFGVSNVLAIGLGWLGINGALTGEQYLGVAFGLVGITFVIAGVRR